MSDTKKKNPVSFLAGFFSLSLSLGAIFLAVGAIKDPSFMLPAILLFILSNSVKAYRKGILPELLSFARIAGAFTLGWLFKAQAGELLQIKGIFSGIVGFYSVFLLSFFVAGKLINTAMRDHDPSMPSKLLGAFAGAFEGLVIGCFVYFALTMIPGSKLAESQPGFLKELTGSTEKIIAPLLPEEASNAVRAAKAMSKLSKGIDPEKVDREELVKVMQPISDLPEIQEIRQDRELQQIIAEKNFPKLLKHPTVIRLMENPDLQKRLLEIDWKRMERALNKRSDQEP